MNTEPTSQSSNRLVYCWKKERIFLCTNDSHSDQYSLTDLLIIFMMWNNLEPLPAIFPFREISTAQFIESTEKQKKSEPLQAFSEPGIIYMTKFNNQEELECSCFIIPEKPRIKAKNNFQMVSFFCTDFSIQYCSESFSHLNTEL